MIICIGGMPGSGKSTVAELVFKQVGGLYIESDDLLSDDLKPKIAAGTKLTDAELDHWICTDVIETAGKLEKEHGTVVLAALLAKPEYEAALHKTAKQAIYINLIAPYDVLRNRVESRDHFATTKTLDFCWEYRDEILFAKQKVDATQSLEDVVSECLEIIKTLPDT